MQEGQRITVRNRLEAAQQRSSAEQDDHSRDADDYPTTATDAASAHGGVHNEANHAAAAPSGADAPPDHAAEDAPPEDTSEQVEDQAAALVEDSFETASRQSSSSCRTDAQASSRRADPAVRVTMAVLHAVEEGGPPVVAVTVQEAPRLPRAANKPQLADMARRAGRQAAVSQGPQRRTESGDLGEWEVVAGQQSLGDSHGRWLLMHAGRQKVVWDDAVELKQEGRPLGVCCVYEIVCIVLSILCVVH